MDIDDEAHPKIRKATSKGKCGLNPIQLECEGSGRLLPWISLSLAAASCIIAEIDAATARGNYVLDYRKIPILCGAIERIARRLTLPGSSGEITVLLAAVKRGDLRAKANLVAMVYERLHAMARDYMRRERANHTLQATALVHEAYLRLVADESPGFEDRVHFFATAATVMRRVLVDYARQRMAEKRGAGHQQVELEDFFASVTPNTEELLILDEALGRLAACNDRQSRLVEMRYFGGLTEEEAATALGISVRTAKRDWMAARAWLQGQLRQKDS
jgi:RNA polymerase sigma factor (TIGR02999 family)